MGLLRKKVSEYSTKKWVAFDFDGTIAETTTTLISFYNEYIAEKHHIRTLSTDELEELKNMTTSEKLAYMKIPFYKLPFVIGSARKFFPNIMQELPVATGLQDALIELKKRGYHLAILSSNKKSNIELYLAQHQLAQYFDYISCDKGRSLFVKHKTLRAFLDEKNIPTSQFIYVGDETRDIIACKKADVKALSVSWGWDSREVLQVLNPTGVADSPEELVSLITTELGPAL